MNQEIWNRTEWFRQARFGMFIHWGLYAIPAQGEWVMSHKRMTVKEYEKYFYEFNPTDYNPKEWARLAKVAGMRYAVLTAKHHDGFCLFDSQYTDYKATNTKAGCDLVKEFLEAFRAEGIKVGLYFTLIDWHHPDYPKYNDAFHPMRQNDEYKDEKINFDRYLDYMHNQVKEIVTNYGKLDILWFDFSYDDMCDEKWRATELVTMVRRYQPDVIIDNRLEGSGEKNGSIVTKNPSVFSGDFVSPEMIIPPCGMKDMQGHPIPWELCATLNNHWGYCYHDKTYKSPETIIRKIVECVSKGGNFILNIGPDAKGKIPQKSQEILETVGMWLKNNGESIYGCGIADFPKPEWGRYTQKGNMVYAHIYETPLGALPLYNIDSNKIKSIYFVASGANVPIAKAWNLKLYNDVVFVSLGEDPIFSYPLPDEIDTVLRIELKN